jgi:hypothetical protein
MKTRVGNRFPVAVMIFIVVLAATNNLAGQTTMGILPVNIASVGSNVLSDQQWQSVVAQLHDELVMQLTGTINVSKLSREHILLLLKEVPAPDPENLDAESYKIISKKEKLHYLLKCSLETVQVKDKQVNAPVRVLIVDGNTGNLFWEKTLKNSKTVPGTALNEQVLLDQVYKPCVEELSKEVKALKY